jgi:CRP-like cAMP-binding protein
MRLAFPTITVIRKERPSRSEDHGEIGSALALLERIDLFDGLPPAELDRLATDFEVTGVRPGDSLEVQDTPVERWALLARGHALVSRDGTPLGLLGRGRSWSEHSILNDQRSPISVVAFSPATLLTLRRDRFLDLLAGPGTLRDRIVTRSAASPDRLALPVHRALAHMEEAAQRTEAERTPLWEPVLFAH